jgi:hypothetical protein
LFTPDEELNMRWRMIISLLVIAWVVFVPVIANEEVGMAGHTREKVTPTPQTLTTPSFGAPTGFGDLPDYSRTKEPALVLNDDGFTQYLNDLPLGEYILCFYADTTSRTGHGFIKIRFPNGVTHGFGFYPSPTGFEPYRLFDLKTGMIDTTDIRNEWTAKVCYKINKYQAQAVLSVVHAYRYAPYHLFTNNCVHFVNAVAKAADLPQISGTDTMTRPGNLYENIKQQPGSVENTNRNKKLEMTQDPSGKWVQVPPSKGTGIPDPVQVNEESKSPQPVQNEIGSARPSKNSIQTPQGLINTVNEKVGMLPSDLQKMIDNRRVLVVMTGEKGDPQLSPVGFTFRGTTLADVGSGVDNPDYRVSATARAVDSLFSAQDPVTTFRSALARGDVQIQPSAPGDMALIGGAGFLNKVSLLMSPSQYQLKVGQQKDVTISGTGYTLLRPKNIILLQKKDSNDATVINSAGATQGYTTAGTARVITLSTQDHSIASGVYTSPAEDIGGAAQGSFAVPDSFRPGTGPAITDPSAATLQGGADAAHLIAGGAGFLNGYGGRP